MSICTMCRHYQPPDFGSRVRARDRTSHGRCHRYPPNSDGQWAKVQPDSWCGEWAAVEFWPAHEDARAEAAQSPMWEVEWWLEGKWSLADTQKERPDPRDYRIGRFRRRQLDGQGGATDWDYFNGEG